MGMFKSKWWALLILLVPFVLSGMMIVALVAIWAPPQDRQQSFNQPVGAWIEVHGHAVAVRLGEITDGVRLIEFIDDWPTGEPAIPPDESLTDPRWNGRLRIEGGKTYLVPAPILE